MSKNLKESGGPAFPAIGADRVFSFGMTLRDYFAAKAMHALIIAANDKITLGKNYPDNNVNFAIASYAIADAMLKARSL